MQDSMLPRLKRPISGIEQLDRVEWADGISFLAYGLRIGGRVNNVAVLKQIAGRYMSYAGELPKSVH